MKCVNVRFGSKADIGAGPRDVRFTPKSRHWNSVVDVRFVPKADIVRCGEKRCYSITGAGEKRRRQWQAGRLWTVAWPPQGLGLNAITMASGSIVPITA